MMNRRRWLRAFLGSGLAFLLAIGALYWVLASGSANGLIREFIAQELSSQLSVRCQVGGIEGNPFGRYQIIDVQVGDLLSVDTVTVRTRHVLAFRVVIDTLSLKGCKITIPQCPPDHSPADLSKVRTVIPFEVTNLEIDRGSLNLGHDVQVSQLFFRGAFSARGNVFNLSVSRYQSKQFDPPLVISNLSGVGVLDGGEIALQNVSMSLPHSQMWLNGKFGTLDRPTFDLAFRADPFAVKDFENWLGTKVPPLSLVAEGHLKGGLKAATAQMTVQLDSTLAHLTLEGSLSPMDVRIDKAAVLRAFRSTSILGDEGIDITVDGSLDGVAYIDSVGLNILSANAHLTRLIAEQVEQTDTRVKVGYDAGNVSVALDSKGAIGSLDLESTFQIGTQTGEGKAAFEGLDLGLLAFAPTQLGKMNGQISVVKDSIWRAHLLIDDGVYDAVKVRDLKAHLEYAAARVTIPRFAFGLPAFATQVSGKGVANLGIGQKGATLHLMGATNLEKLLNDTILGERLDFDGRLDVTLGPTVSANMTATGTLTNFQVGVDSLRLESFVGADQDFSVSGDAWGSDGKVGVSGQVGRDGRLDFAVSGVLKSTAGLGRLTGYRLAADSLHILGEVSGTLATPSIQFDLEMPAAQIEEIPMQDFTVSGNWRSPGDGSVSLRVGALSWGKNRFSDVFFDATRSGPKTDFLFGSNANKGDRIYLWGQVEADGKMIRVTADSMHVQASQVSLYNQGPLNVTYDPARGFHIDRFELAGPAGRIVARDHPDFKSVIEVLLHDMDLRPWVFMAGRPDVVGVMDAELVFSGDLSDPLVFVEGHLRQVDAYGFHVPAVAGNFSYGDRRMLVDLVLEPDHGKPITVSGVVPVDSDEPLELFLKSGGLAMTLLDTFVTGSAQMDGDLAVELRVRGSRDSPTYQGKLTWDNGKISHPSSGRVYEPVFARVQMDQNQVRLDSLVIGGMDERLAVKGTVELDDGEPGSFELQMDFEHFQPVYWPELKAEFSGQLQMNGTPHRPRLSGDLLVQKADIRLGELMATPSSGWDQAPFVRALQMAITVRADQQVWVRDQTFNIEMTGDLDVTKDIEGFKVFGNMQSRRGNYFFQNRRLGVTRGEISFQGKSPIDPNLDIEAQTRVMARLGPSLSGASSDGGPEPVTVTVGVGGTLSHPIITLSSTPSVGQFDEVLSVLVVGATRDAIAVSSASDLVLSTLANRFGQRLGEDLKLDLVEVDVSEANISRIRVGKYLTPRLFVSYAQDMSSTGREVAIDFRLLPSITIEARQIDSGKEAQLIKQTRESIDVVWEREW